MGWFSGDTVKIVIDSELNKVIDTVINNGGARNKEDAIRYAILRAVFPWSNKTTNKQGESTKKRESSDKRAARLTAVLEQIISNNEKEGQPVLMRITAEERAHMKVSDIAVKHWQLAITERILRDQTGVNQAIASKFSEQHKKQIDQHNKWLFDNCGWTPKDASAFNRRTKAAARKFSQLDLG